MGRLLCDALECGFGSGSGDGTLGGLGAHCGHFAGRNFEARCRCRLDGDILIEVPFRVGEVGIEIDACNGGAIGVLRHDEESLPACGHCTVFIGVFAGRVDGGSDVDCIRH